MVPMTIEIYFGRPGAGKSYLATLHVSEELRKKRGRPQYTNFPVRWKDTFSFFWDFPLVHEAIFDSDVHMDEAYRDVNSRDWKNFDEDTHLFFSTHRHNGNNIYLYAQSPARIDKIIREIAVFYWVRPMRNPFTGTPLWFKIEIYEDEDALKDRYKIKTSGFRVRFKKEVAKCYDTKQFRKKNEVPYKPVPWNEILGIEIKKPARRSLFPWKVVKS